MWITVRFNEFHLSTETSIDKWPTFDDTLCMSVSRGWRLQDSYIDSGIGHGTPVSVTLSINVTVCAHINFRKRFVILFLSDIYWSNCFYWWKPVKLEQPGEVLFEFTFECNRTCFFSFWDSRGLARFYMSPYSNRTVREILPLSAGQHGLFWIYEHYQPSDTDKVLIRVRLGFSFIFI